MSFKRQRNRGFLLTDTGKLKLETARQEAEESHNGGKRYTVEQLSQITELDLSTITRIFDSSTRTDRRTIERLFKAFNLNLETTDFYKPQLKANLQSQLTSALPIYYPANNSKIYGRERELKQLKECVFNNQNITLYGTIGVGKTALAIQLVDEVKDSFKYVYWRSLESTDSPMKVTIAILRYLSLEVDQKDFNSLITQLIILLQQQRCLIVFDCVETVFDRQTTAFLDYLSTAAHNSCIILISRQRLNTVVLNKSRSFLVEEINLEAGKKLLRDRSIFASDKTLGKLVETYNAHPLSLHLAATTISDIFDGDVREFLAYKVTIFNEIEKTLKKQLQQLSALEISILYWLAVNIEPISLTALKEDTIEFISSNQIIEGLRKLINYLLIKKNGSKFTLQPFLKKYIINHLVQQTCKQIVEERDELLITNALIKASAPQFIRQQQVELVLKPIADKLIAQLGRDRLFSIMSNLLARQRKYTPRQPGYLAGNIFNLLRYLETDLHRWNFSSLSVWQADGRGINLRHCNFAFSDLTHSKFTEDFGETLFLAVSSDKEQLAACDTNGQIRLWNLKNRRQQQTLRGHSAWTQMVLYSPDGQILASCSSDRTIRLWDLTSGSCIGVLKSHQGRVRAIAFTPDGQILASAGDDLVIKLWDIDTQTVIQTLEGHTDNIRSIVISPDEHLISSGDDGSIRFWIEGKCLRTIMAHQKPVWTIAISPNGSLIASGSVDNTVKLWDRTGVHLATLQHQGAVSRVAFSNNGIYLATASYDRTVRIWDISSKRQLKTLPHNDWVQSLVFVGDSLITCSRDRQIRYWNVNTERVENTIDSYSNGIWAIAVSPDSKQIASTNDEQTIQLWNVASNKIERVLRGHAKSIWSVAYSYDSRFLASASDDCTVRIWNKLTGRLYRTIQGNSWFWTVAFDPNDSSILATAGANSSIQFWNINTGKVVKTFNGHTDIIRQIAFDSEGRYLASCGLDSTARVWQINTGECVSIFNHPSPVSSIAFSPKRSILATGSDDNVVRLWDLDTGQIWQSLEEHTGWVQSVAFSLDGELLASGSHDGTIKLWQVGQKQAFATFTHGGWVRAIAFRICPTTGQLQLVSGSQDGTIKLWNINTQSCIKTLSPPQPYSQMNITGVTGLSEPERETLMALGAIETNISTMDNVVFLKQCR